MAKNDFPVSLTITAIDKATAKLNAITDGIKSRTAPFRNYTAALGELSKTAGVDKLKNSFLAAGSSVAGVAGEVNALAFKLAAIGGAAGFGFAKLIGSAIEHGDKLSEVAQRVGLTADAYKALEREASLADISQEDFSSGIDQFNKRMGELRIKSGPLFEFLEKHAPKVAEQLQKTGNTSEAFGKLVDVFQKVKDPAMRAALAAEAFGKSGLQFGQFAGQGGEGLERIRKALTLTAGPVQEFADRSSDIDNRLKMFGARLVDLRDKLAGAFYPAITKVFDRLARFLDENQDRLIDWATRTGKAIADWVDGGGLDRLIDGIGKVAKGIGRVVEFLGPTGTGFAALAVLSAPLVGSIVSLAASFVGLAVNGALASASLAPLGITVGALAGGVLAVTAAFVSWGVVVGEIIYYWGDLKLIISETWDAFTKFGDGIKSFKNIAAGIGGAIGGDRGFALTTAAFDFADRKLGAERPAPASKSEVKITADFVNVPKGVRVDAQTSGADFGLNVGKTMQGAF